MADEPILGLFDSDNNFLDELTGNGTDLGSVISSEGDGMLGQAMPPIGSTPQMGPGSTSQLTSGTAPQMPSGQSGQGGMMMGQGAGGYQSMGPEGYGGMVPSGADGPGPPGAAQYSSATDPVYSQYGSMPKMAQHHGDGMMGMGMQPQAPGGMSVLQQQQQFGSPPAGGMMQQHAGYQGYNMPPGPMPGQQQPPMAMMGQQAMMGPQQAMMGPQQAMMGQQQAMMGQQQGMMAQQQSMMGSHQGLMGQQAGGWNPAQTSPTGGHPQFMSAQAQQAGAQGCMPQPMGQSYMGQHDYGMQQNMGHYGDGSGYMQQQTPMASPGGMPMMGSPMQRPPRPQFQAQSPMRQPNPALSGYPMQQSQRYPGDYMAQRPSMNPNPAQQRYPYPQSSGPGPQAMAPDGSPMGHFPSPGPTSSYMSSYPGASHATATASPRPPAVSQSMAGSHSSGAMGQASYGQSHLQELEQLVSPTQTSGAIPSANPYQQIMQSSGTSASNVPPHSPIYSSSPNFPTNTLPSSPSPVQASSNVGMNCSSPLSPNPGMRQGSGQQSGIAMEIQRLDNHIQQLFNMPQSQQISQQMLDAQERLRILKAQQQQQIMQIQRQQQQHMSVSSPTRLVGKPNFGQQQQPSQPQLVGMNQPRPRMPGPMNTPPLSVGGPGGPGPMMAPSQASQLLVQGQHLAQQISPQRPPSQSTPISSPQRIQPFQSPTSSTPGDGLSVPTPPSQPMVVQQAADSMTDPVQMTPPMMHSTPLPERRLDADIIKVISSDPLPATVTEIAEAQEGQGEKPKRKRERKPKGDKTPKTPKEPKEKKPRTPKTPKEPKPPKPPKEPKPPRTPKAPKSPKVPKEPKEPKEKKPRARRSKKAKEEGNESMSSDLNISTDLDVEKVDTSDPTVPTTTTQLGESTTDLKSDDQATPKKKTASKDKKPRTPKVIKPLKKPSNKKRKPPASLFLKKQKRKRGGSDGSDVEMNISPVGSPVGEDDSTKRRSSRNTKRKKYLDDIDLNLSDDEHLLDPIENTDGPVAMKTESEEDILIVERILGNRIRKRDAEELEEGAEEEEEEEFLVKYKNYSYLHCEWRTVAEIGDKRFPSKIKRFRQKKERMPIFEEPDDEEYFNPEYVEVDRVLSSVTSKDPTSEEEITHYLVKWRVLTYEESTWELAQDVDPAKVKLYKKKQQPPPEDERGVLARPKPQMWKKKEEVQEYKGSNKLREYQLEGLNWLTFCWHNGQNCILADEMGLGKTIQSITFLNEISQYGIRGPFLIIVPLSTLGNWQREFETWTDMNSVVYHGPSNCRTIIQDYELFFKDENNQKIPEIYKFDALITTYEIILADIELLTSIEWRCCIIDEAHRLKNKNCRLLEGLRLFDVEHRVLLTGTPLQNNTEELFSLLNFLNPTKFASSTTFLEEFGTLKTESQVDKLKEILKPMMLRRLKEDVEKNLAPKEETIIEVELTNIQKKYYRAILERNFQFLSKGGTTNMPSLMNAMMELRKCCNHPYLINGAEEQILIEQEARGGMGAEQLLAALVTSSGKMVLMDKLLPRLKQGGHKVLIFSQMIRVLDIIEDYLLQKKYLYERLDGRIRGSVRQEAIDRFSKPESDRFVFLLCTRAGGLGINLTAADTVVIYDSDWNPQNDLQAQARCHRIGQSKAVKVYRLVTRNSYEREMFDKASLKLGLDKAVLQSINQGEKSVNPASQMTKKEVEDLLKKGAYGALMEDDSAGDKFCEEDIDLILKRRTKIIQIESEGKGSTFAKASFSVSGNRTDIDINDPNFWQKWAKKADIDVEKMNKKNDLILQEPRQRRQTSRYGKEEAVMEISDLDSSSDSDDEMKLLRKGRKLRRSGRAKDDDFSFEDVSTDGYSRSDCFKVEKNLLVYGWGRWREIIQHSHFKNHLGKNDVEIIARAILAHSLKFYKGDDKIKGFIWDLIANNNEGGLKNHLGLSAPVPRGRKGKKAKEKKPMAEEGRSLDFDPEIVLDNGYKRHLHRHSNKVLLRVRLLYYIKQEVIGDDAEKVFAGARCHEVEIPPPICEGEIPAVWWDQCADRCLLLGIFKHGYEKYNQMRQDNSLCFLTRCGPPDGAALLAEQNDDKEDEDELEDKLLKDDDEGDVSQSSVPDTVVTTPIQPISEQTDESGEGKYPFPNNSDLTLRLRRVITGYQRMHKKMMEKQEQFARRKERREQQQLSFADRVTKKKEFQNSRWSRREEADFYRTVSTFGVEFDRDSGRFKWDRFRTLARLDRKSDDTITEYFHAFYYMCQTVCGKFRADDRDAQEAMKIVSAKSILDLWRRMPPPPNGIFVEKITEERASRCLARIDLLNKIRDDILPHPDVDERVKLCQPSFDMPTWWQCGTHDKELLIGAARHGVARTDYNILRDPDLSFHEVLLNSGRHLRSNPNQSSSTPIHGGMEMSPALHDDDLESDSKSQDSMDLRDSHASSPPLLGNGKVQYSRPQPNTDTDAESEGGPPKLERAVSPGAESECVEGKKDGSTTDAASPADTIEAAAEPMDTVDEEAQDPSSPSAATKCKDTDGEKPPQPSPKDSIPMDAENVKSPSDQDVEKEAKSDTALTPAEEGEKEETSPQKGEQSDEVVSESVTEKKMEVDEAPDIKEEEMVNDKESPSVKSEGDTDSSVKVKTEEPEDLSKVKQENSEDVSDQKPLLQKEAADSTEKNSDDAPLKKEGSPAAVKKENGEVVKTEEECLSVKTENDDAEVKSETSSTVKEEDDSTESKAEEPMEVKEEKPEYVKLKEKIMQGEVERLQREKLAKENQVSAGVSAEGLSPMATGLPGQFADDSPYVDTEGLEPGEIVPGRPFVGPAVDWPKDRVIFHRLERICYTVEKGKWPFSSYSQPPPYDSRSQTPVGPSTPRPDSASESGDVADLNQVMHPPGGGEQGEKDFEVHLSQNEGLKMTFHKRPRGRGRGAARYDMDPEKTARVQQLLNQSNQAMGSSDNDSQQEPINPSTQHSASSHQSTSVASSPMRDSPMSDEQLQHSSAAEQGYMYMEHQARRGRKRKAEKMADQMMAEALAKREQARILASLEPDMRVPVINLEDGSILSGEEAPKKYQLEKFLREHPGYMVYAQAASGFPPRLPPAEDQLPPNPMAELQAAAPVRERRKPGRKPKLDPTTLYTQSLTGEENVSVVEKGSGRKITGAKAPPLKHLKEWLEQNPTFDVEPKWGELLRAKGALPASMESRLLKPSGRGRKPRNAGLMHANMAASPADFMHMGMGGMPGFAAGMLGGAYPKMPLGMPFPMGMANPMLGLAAAGFPMAGFPLHGALGKEGEEGGKEGGAKEKKKKSSSSTSDAPSTSSPSATASPHPSFPGYFFNPMAFNPMLASQLAANFPMANFNLAHMAALNGMPDGSPGKEEFLAAAAAAAAASAQAQAPAATTPSRKEKAGGKHHQPSAKSEKGHDLTKIVEKIKDSKDHRLGASSHSPAPGRAQDLGLKAGKEGAATPSPAHTRSSRPPSAVSSSSSQDQATDLSIKAKPCPSTTPPTPPHKANKNKIHKSFSLNKIVDTLKEKIEEKSKKKDGDPGTVDKRDSGADDSSPAKEAVPAADAEEEQPENLSHSQVTADSSSSDNPQPAAPEASEPSVQSDKADTEQTAEEPPSLQQTEEEKSPAAENTKDSTTEEAS